MLRELQLLRLLRNTPEQGQHFLMYSQSLYSQSSSYEIALREMFQAGIVVSVSFCIFIISQFLTDLKAVSNFLIQRCTTTCCFTPKLESNTGAILAGICTISGNVSILTL